jgi:hypothetical protein
VAREHSEKARARAKAWAPDFDAARRPAGLLIPDGIAGLTGRLRETISEWAAAEAAPGRMLPWVPVSFGLGIVGYFAADREPTWWASVTFAFLTSSWPVWRVDDQSPFRWRQTWRRWPPGLRQPRCRRCVLHIRSCCIWYRARWLPVSSRLASQGQIAASGARLLAALRQHHRRAARRYRQAHPRGDGRRPRFDRLCADHWKTRYDLGVCQRCDVRFKPVICCFVPVRYWTVVQSAQDSGPRIHITSS